MKTFAINGAGRIGRIAFRIWWEKHREKLDLKVINTSGSMDIASWVHLLKHDTVYGAFPNKITFEEEQNNKNVSDEKPELGHIKIDEHEIIITAQKDPEKLPWKKHGVEIVLESTGHFNTPEKARLHLKAGAKKVLISAAGKNDKNGEISTAVIGVNQLDQSKNIFSNASCTTNCVAPVLKIMKESIGVEKALLTTIHSYTHNQNTQDNSHKKDLRRARAAAENIIPTTTGAAKATIGIIPSMKGKFNGLAIRVPTPTVSLIDLTILSRENTSLEKIQKIFIDASKNNYKNIVAVTNEPLVSSDYIGCEYSAVVDLDLIQIVGGNLIKIIAWYDNEWGYTVRLMEQILKI